MSFNVKACYPKWKTWYLMQQMFYPMWCPTQKRVNQCKNSCYPTWKGVIKCKKCAIQRSKRDIPYENQAEKNCHNKKMIQVIKTVKYRDFFAFLVLLCPFLSPLSIFSRIFGTFISLFVPLCPFLSCYF